MYYVSTLRRGVVVPFHFGPNSNLGRLFNLWYTDHFVNTIISEILPLLLPAKLIAINEKAN